MRIRVSPLDFWAELEAGMFGCETCCTALVLHRAGGAVVHSAGASMLECAAEGMAVRFGMGGIASGVS
jgi:hypothetical protein